jgi:hypothetical protein
MKDRGIRINVRNINSVCHSKKVVNGKYSYVRSHAGGYCWFFADEVEKYKDLIF